MGCLRLQWWATSRKAREVAHPPGCDGALSKKQVLHFVQDDKIFRFVSGRLGAWVLVLSLD